MAQDAIVLNKRDIARFQKRLATLQAFVEKLAGNDGQAAEPVKRRRRRRRRKVAKAGAEPVVRRRRKSAGPVEPAPAGVPVPQDADDE